MQPEDLMNADMLSEILLLVSASAILVTLLVILAAVLTQRCADIARTQGKADEAGTHTALSWRMKSTESDQDFR
jgi:hypothetical protein